MQAEGAFPKLAEIEELRGRIEGWRQSRPKSRPTPEELWQEAGAAAQIPTLDSLGRPQDGTLFVFRGRQATAIMLLVYDGQGFWLATKRLSAGKFRYWPALGTSGEPAPGA